MLFNSLEYAVFLPVAACVFFLLPHRLRTLWLLMASSYFYMVLQPVYILVLLGLIVVDYVAALGLSRTASAGSARLMLLGSVTTTCLVLCVFKYYNFIDSTLSTLLLGLGVPYAPRPMHILLPVGLSFHTFQSLSYVFEVYAGRQRPERNFINYATYVMFFPQLVAGPIERPQTLLPQFRRVHAFDADLCISGLKRIAFGLFKKCVVADRLALFVSDVYSDVHGHSETQLALAMLLFPYQVYCDFSGYSDIAIGSARIMGFRLSENFRMPFHARTMTELWQRWHISLTSWFRDYLWTPLRRPLRHHPAFGAYYQLRTAGNLLIVFTISGLWHGAGWPYVLWGFLNGCVVAVERFLKSHQREEIPQVRHRWMVALRIVRTYAIFALLLVIFRAPTFSDGIYALSHLAFRPWHDTLATARCGTTQLMLGVLSVMSLAVFEILIAKYPVTVIIGRWPRVVRWNCYAAAVLGIVFLGVFEKTPFFYFQF